MELNSPVVLEGVDVPGLIQYVLDKHTASSCIIVCGSKGSFLEHLQAALTTAAATETDDAQIAPQKQLLAKPTLRLLAASRTVRLVFCPELAHLRAYLATYAYRDTEASTVQPNTTQKSLRILAILNPIQAHKPTSAYSAQGINRTFAAAVEAAHGTQSQLTLAECPFSIDDARIEEPLPFEDESLAANMQAEANPWNQAVSILNVTTKSFGVGERGWVGRTVALRRIAERWCRFVDTTGSENA